jgi:hypothetical protein
LLFVCRPLGGFNDDFDRFRFLDSKKVTFFQMSRRYKEYFIYPFGCVPLNGNLFGSLPVGWGGIGRRAGVSADAAPVAGVIRC